MTPPLDGLILEGVTRQSILDLAREWVFYLNFLLINFILNSIFIG